MSDSREADLQQKLETMEASAAKVVPRASAHLRTLMTACDAVSRNVIIDESDHFGFMAVQFNAKQIHHADALLTLEDRGDTALVARSMLEGMCLLKWVKEHPEQPERWRMYLAVVGERMEASGHGRDRSPSSRDPATERALDMFLTDRARAAKASAQPLPADPWASRWYRPQLRQIFEEVGESRNYDISYTMMSDWHHWAPSGLALSLSVSASEMRFRPRSAFRQLGSLGTAYVCLATTGLLVGEHFRRSETSDISSAVKQFAADHELQATYRQDSAGEV